MTGQLFRALGTSRRAAARASRQLLASICLLLLAAAGTTGCAAAGAAPTTEALVQFVIDTGGVITTVQQVSDVVRAIYHHATHVPATPAGATSIVVRQGQSDGVADVLQLNLTGHLVFNITGNATLDYDGSTVTLTVPPVQQAVQVTKAGDDAATPYQLDPVPTLDPLPDPTTPAATTPAPTPAATTTPPAPTDLFPGGGGDSQGPDDTPTRSTGILFPPPTAPAPTTQDPPPPATYSETTGPAGSGTFTNFTNASGTGQRIAAYQTVEISCVVQGFAVQDGTTTWYRVTSPPWNDQYYASSDNFYNNGATSGDVNTGVWVDSAVPPC